MFHASLGLPPLREELEIFPSSPDANGSPSWVIHDPVRNQFYYIGWTEYELLSHWHIDDKSILLETINNNTTLHVTEEDLQALVQFLSSNFLIKQDYTTINSLSDATRTSSDKSKFMWLVHHYLFFRVPLVHPDNFLEKTKKAAQFFFHKYTFVFMMSLALLGLFMISQRWEDFTHTFMHFFSLEGIFFYLIAIGFYKLGHELGHAYMCKVHGIRVPSMGVAFLVMFPLLYTDTSESWRLVERNRRAQIGLAGIWVETYIAIIATFLWSFLPEGPFKSIAFFIVAISWPITVLININPLVQFDGYHVLSDFLGMKNMQRRAFALAKWRMRKLLLGYDDFPPEPLPKKLQNGLIFYAVCCWIYRLLLFLSIAILVYYLFFKILGILLFTIEILFFIVLPIFREIRVWWRLRKTLKWNKNLSCSAGVLAVLLILFFTPWRSSVSLPAVLDYHHQLVFSTKVAEVKEVLVKRGEKVKTGQLLFILHSPTLDLQIKQHQAHLHNLQIKLRQALVDPKAMQEHIVIKEQIAEAKTSLAALENDKENLYVHSDMSGTVNQISPGLKPGAWIKEDQLLAVVVNQKLAKIEAFVETSDLSILKKGSEGVFIPDGWELDKLPATVSAISYSNVKDLGVSSEKRHGSYLDSSQYVPARAYLSSTYGGTISTEIDSKKRIVPVESIYRILLSPDGDVNIDQVTRGRVKISAKPESLASKSWAFVAAVLVRESGF